MEKWSTAISTRRGEELYIRGQKLSVLIENYSFLEIVFLLWRGKLPRKKEILMFNALLVAASEHGLEAPSTFVARTVASTGNPLNSALSAGFLTMGEWHGGAVEKAAQGLQSKTSAKKIVQEVRQRGERLPGFGHKVYKEGDPRVRVLFSMAKRLGFRGHFVKKALALGRELKKQTGKTLPLNIDGAMAALLLELGFDWRLAKGIFMLSRLAGLVAHIHEETVCEKPYRRLSEEDVIYRGPRIKR